MTIVFRGVPIAACLALLMSASAACAIGSSWDGTWKGSLRDKGRDISVVIAKDKVVQFAIMGTPLPVAYANFTPSSVSFGDRDHYNLTMTKAGEAKVSATYHGLHGYSKAALVKQ